MLSLAAIVRHLGTQSSSDRELLLSLASHPDGPALSELIRRYAAAIQKLAKDICPSQADDITQAAFVILAQKASAVASHQCAAAWLFETTRRLAIKARGREYRRIQFERQAPSRPHSGDPSEELTYREVRMAVHEELSRLPQKLQEPLLLCYWEGATQQDAAARLGYSLSTFKRHLEKGRSRLEARLIRRGFSGASLLAALAVSKAPARSLSTVMSGEILEAVSQKSLCSSSIAVLVEGTTRGAIWGKVALLTACLVLAGVGYVLVPPTGDQSSPKKEVEEKKLEQKESSDQAQHQTDAYGDDLPKGAIVRLGTERFRSDAWLTSVAADKEGKHLFGVGSRSVIQWDAQTGKEMRRFAFPWKKLKNAHYPVRPATIAVSPGGDLMAVGTTDGSTTLCPIVIFDLRNGQKIGELAGHMCDSLSANIALQFISEKCLVSSGNDHQTIIWDIDNKCELVRLDQPEKSWITRLSVSQDGKRVYGSGGKAGEGIWRCWNTESGKVILAHQELSATFISHSLSTDGKWIALAIGKEEQGGARGQSEVWIVSAENGNEKRRWMTHQGAYPHQNSVTFSPDGHWIVSGGADGKVRRWEAETGKEIGEAIQPNPYANRVGFLNANILFTHGSQQTICFWDRTTAKPKLDFAGAKSHLAALAYSPDGKYLATGGGGGDASIYVWNSATGRQVSRIDGISLDITSTQFSPDGSQIAWADSQGIAHLWDWKKNKSIREFKGHTGWVYSLSFNSDGTRLATGDQVGNIRVWNTHTGAVEHLFQGHTAHVPVLVFTSDGKSLFSGSWDHSIRRWSLQTGKQVWGIKNSQSVGNPTGHSMPVHSLALSPGGHWLYSASLDNTIGVWEASSGQFCKLLKKNSTELLGPVALSPNGKSLAVTETCTQAEGRVKEAPLIYELAIPTGAKQATFDGHRGKITGVAYSPDGTTLASISADTTGLVWKVPGQTLPTNTPAKLTTVMDNLASSDSMAVYEAFWQAVSLGDTTTSKLDTQFKALAILDKQKVVELVVKLDSPRFAEREKASAELAKLDLNALPILQKSMKETKSEEVRSRLETILGQLEVENRRWRISVEILEMIDTPAAHKLLRELSEKGTTSELKAEATNALKRLAHRSQPATPAK